MRERGGRKNGAGRGDLSLLAHLVHDLKNPLGLVVGYAEALTLTDASEHAELSARLMVNARALLEVLDEYSLLSDLRRRRVRLDRAACNWQAVAGRVIKALRETARERDHEITNPHEHEVTVYADPQRFEQMVRLLVREALRATPRGTRVELSAHPTADNAVEVRLDVSPGAVENMPDVGALSVFDVERPAVELVQRVVDLHGGSLTLTHEARHAAAHIRLPN